MFNQARAERLAMAAIVDCVGACGLGYLANLVKGHVNFRVLQFIPMA
jgi:hypothetical protein